MSYIFLKAGGHAISQFSLPLLLVAWQDWKGGGENLQIQARLRDGRDIEISLSDIDPHLTFGARHTIGTRTLR